MSQVVTIKRKISAVALRDALQQVEGLAVGDVEDWGFTLQSSEQPDCLLVWRW